MFYKFAELYLSHMYCEFYILKNISSPILTVYDVEKCIIRVVVIKCISTFSIHDHSV